MVNIEVIKYIEAVPDTVIFFLNGDSLIVLESIDNIMQFVIDFKSKILIKSQMVPQA